MNHDVTPLQAALLAIGFDPGPVDGVFGLQTREAMNAYQESVGLIATQQPDLETCISLGIVLPDFPLQQHATVRNGPMQNILGGIFSGLFGNLLKWDLVSGYIRTALTSAGGWIGLDGLVGSDGSKAIIGAILVILGVIWQAIANNQAHKAMQVVKAVDAHDDITVIPAANTALGKPIVTVAK